MIWNETDLKGTVDVQSFESDVLKENPLNDPPVRDLHVYLPPGYKTSNEPYPVLYVLSGFGGSSRKYLSNSTFVPGIHHQYEELLDKDRGNPAILVFPDCKTSLGGSQYMNSSAVGQYESYVVDEIASHVDESYRTISSAGSRGVFGKSSGGFAALRFGMKFPQQFGVIGCHAGDMMFKYCYMPDIPDAAEAVTHAGSKEEWLDKFRQKTLKGKGDFPVLNIIAMSACYSPDPENPDEFDLPFSEDTGAFRPEVWKRWEQHDPLQMVDSHADALDQLRYLYIDVGKNDEFHLQLGARMLHDSLNDLGIVHEYHEFDGGHMKTRALYPPILEKLTGNLTIDT